RILGGINLGQGQYYDVKPTIMEKCGQSVTVQPPNDVTICNGQLVEAQTDQGGVTSIAMYPKQPFDISGRTGTVVFDVSDDSHGTHRAWPELWFTDQPVPTPFTHFSSLQSVPRNGLGVRFAGACPPGHLDCRVILQNCPTQFDNDYVITVDSAVVVNNYVSNDSANGGALKVQQVGCVKGSSGPGDMNHFEVQVSQGEIDVYGTDAGATAPLRKLAIISNPGLTITRGLIWLEDVHYNGDKDGPDQGTHTFTWDNLGFDGPVLPRDLAFDVPDRMTPVGPSYPGLLNLGWAFGPTDSDSVTLTVPGVFNMAQATGALLTLNFTTQSGETNLSYRLNDSPWHEQAWPFPACSSCTSSTIALPVNLSEVQAGDNTVTLKSSSFGMLANVDLILQGAAGSGSGCAPNCPVATTTTLVSSKNPATLGDSITLTATVMSTSGVPAGTVTFTDSGSMLGSAQLGSSGMVTFTTTALAVGSHTLTAAYSGGTGFISSESSPLAQVVNSPAAVIRFDFESGNLQGWQAAWGKSLAVSNSTDQAFTGRHSLRLAVSSTETHSAVDVETAAQLAGFNPGTMVTMHVFNGGMNGIVVYPFSYNQNWIPAFGNGLPLKSGWNVVTFTIPGTFSTLHGIGLQVNNSQAQTGNLYLDTVSTM
ncbi:MAG TPA: Ig-like domain-containing protein, partial [Blastocatellia bacterium]|nr:Ig-like domain-containing protein [Blastocatellia bacterium]